MSPTEIWLTAAVAGLAGFVAWFLRWAIAHLESDLSYARKGHERGTTISEKAATVAERKAD